ncbi:MAG: peptide/nickel transport system ATP-binding protein, partial [Halobacteriales archaeon]
NLIDLQDDQLRRIRGNHIAHVFQNPQHTLDPVYTIGDQIAEAITFHQDVGETESHKRGVDLLDRVGIPNAEERVDDYPHEFSGGMKQRVAIAMALAPDPDLLVADEPTTALDLTTQAQLLELIADIQDERDMTVVFVTHDMGIVANIADWVAVMYGGKIMERGGVADVINEPGHPYTQALLQCLPGRGEELQPIGGDLPDPRQPPDGCRFHPRCEHAVESCRTGDQPAFGSVGTGKQEASCVFYGPTFDATEIGGETDD